MTSRGLPTLVLLCALAACATDGAPLPEPITATRPFFSTDTGTAPVRGFELEGGATVDHERSSEVETVLKYGAGERTQLEIGWLPWRHVELDGADEFGPGDVELGVKQRFCEADGALPSLGAQLGVTLPTGARGDELGSGEFDWFVGLIATQPLCEWTCGAYYQLELVGQPGEEHADVAHALALSTVSPFLGRWAILAELVQEYVPEAHEDPTTIALGATWNPDATWILDLAWRIGLDDEAPDWELTFGFARGFGGP